jgi:hypothetical protein
METCYKCFNRRALSVISPKMVSCRFDIEPEITALLAENGFSIKEVAISYDMRSYAD